MNNKIEVPIGRLLVELAERAADHGDEKAVLLVNDIAHELLVTDKIDTADNADFLSVRDYAAMLAQAIREGESVNAVKNSEFRARLN